MASLPEDMRPGPDFYGFPWEIVICAGIVGALFLYRSFQSVSVQIACRYVECINGLN